MSDKDSKRPAPGKKEAGIVNKAVSDKLKAFYQDIASEDVPDRFKDLLDRLDRQSS